MAELSLGVIGLGTMGANLARNAARKGAEVAVYNRTTEKMTTFIEEYKDEGNFIPCETLEDLVNALESPRAILIMVKAGEAVDAVIGDLLPNLNKGDILIDGGNSHYKDTKKRVQDLQKKGIHFIGMGVSGGEEGALHGPSMMPGGSQEGYRIIEPLLTKMAANDGEGGKCMSYCGPDGAGHFVKMVHNGIEYGIMQCIAESYDMLKKVGEYSNEELAKLFAEWNENDPDLQSFLIEITGKIFQKKDDKTGNDLIDMILDKAAQKGTGKWTTEAALTEGIAIPSITAAVDARILSGAKEMRTGRAAHWPDVTEEMSVDKQELATMTRDALSLSIITCYTQGLELIQKSADEFGWELNLSVQAIQIWKGGCIIRSKLLSALEKAKEDEGKGTQDLLNRFAGDHQKNWREFVCLGVKNGIPLPAISASLAYYDAYRTERLPQNLIQAQRDFFGAHTYERIDRKGTFHTEWE